MMYIPQMIQRTLLYYIHNGLPGKLPSDDLDLSSVMDPRLNLLDPDMFQSGSHFAYPFDLTSPKWVSISGRLDHCNGQSFLIPDDRSESIPLHRSCFFEQSTMYEDISDGMAVILLTSDPDEPGTPYQLVVSPCLYRYANCLPNGYDKYFFLKEFLECSKSEQQLLRLFLTEPAIAQSIFCCLAYISSCMYSKTMQRKPDTVDELAADFYKTFAGRLRISVLEAEEINTLYILSDIGRPDTSFPMLLSFWAIMNHCSTWSHPGKNKAATLLDSNLSEESSFCACLSLVCTSADINSLTQQVTEESLFHAEPQKVRQLLMQILYTGIPLKEQLIAKITHQLFYHQKPDLYDAKKLQMLKHTDNWDSILDDVMEKLHSSMKSGKTDYAHALAVLWACELGGKRTYRLREAQQMIVSETSLEGILTGMLMLSMQLQYDCSHSNHPEDPILLEEEGAIVRILKQMLQNPDSPFYPHACVLFRDLSLMCGTDCHILLDRDILDAACKRLSGCRDQIYPALLFSLLPSDEKPPDIPEPIRQELREHFQYLQTLQSDEHIARHFRCCAAVGCWDDAELLHNYRSLLKWIDKFSYACEWEGTEYMKKIVVDMMPLFSCPANSGSLTADTVSLLFSSAPDFPWPHCAGQEIASEHQALEIIRYVRDHMDITGFDWNPVRQSLQCCRFCADASSLVIVQWFYVLCFLQLNQDACRFYTQFQIILNRPVQFLPDTSPKAFLRPYHGLARFVCSRSRLLTAIHIAALTGNNALIWELVSMNKSDTKLCAEFLSVAGQLLFGGCSGKTGILKEAFVQPSCCSCLTEEALMDCWYRYYDDPGLTGILLEQHPASHKTILSFGYGGVQKTAIIAVASNAESICYLSKELLRDDEVCLAAMNNPQRVLHLLKAPIIFNRPLITQLLEQQEVICSPSHVPQYFLSDRDYALEAMMAYPEEFHLLSQDLRWDKSILLTALAAAAQSEYLIHHIFEHTSADYRKDREIMLIATALNPEIRDLAAKDVQEDPIFQALAARRDYLELLRQKHWKYKVPDPLI